MMTVIPNYWNKREIECLVYPDTLFNIVSSNYDLSDPIVDKIVESVDKSPRYFENIFKSPVFGLIPPTKLCGTTKALLMVLNDYQPAVYSSTVFGYSAFKYLFDLSFKHDFTLVVENSTGTKVPWDYPVCAQTEDGKPLNTYKEVFLYGTGDD